MTLLIEAADVVEAQAALTMAAGTCVAADAERYREALGLLLASPAAFATVRAVLGEVAHDAGPAASAEAGIARVRDAFDRAARVHPEGSVALYALGDAGLLRAATAEIVAWLEARGLVGRGRAVLDIGCGIGRFVQALAPLMGRVTGIDVSGAMIEAAEALCAGLPNTHLRVTSGHDLSDFEDGAFDLLLAVDSFPYLADAGPGLLERHVEEAARVLKPCGDLVILNLSYRGDPDLDRADLARLAVRSRFVSLCDGARAFTLWDGLAFHLRRQA